MKKNEFLIQFLDEIEKKHGSAYKKSIIKNIINEERVVGLPKELSDLGKVRLRKLMTIILINNINEGKYDNGMTFLLLKNKLKRKIKKNKNKIKCFLAGVSIIGAIGLSLKGCDSDLQKTVNNIEYSTEKMMLEESTIEEETSEISLLEERENEIKENLTEEQRKVLNDIKPFTTLSDIVRRKKELEKLKLTDNDKIYLDCPLSAPLQQFIYEMSKFNGYPVDFTFSIIDTESFGNFNSSGIETCNCEESDDYDLGLTQQNTIYSIKRLCDKYNVDINTNYAYIYRLIRDDDYINIATCFLTYDEIRDYMYKMYGQIKLEEYYGEFSGLYNGWINWRNYPSSKAYVENFSTAYTKKYILGKEKGNN